ncbi:type II secretory pathway pseudopilin PulG [Catenuloplanes nepalensis]|uniref:Type II secretory pathway pseudopilin PulG n=1 Tax=Catenuloplanes nepalensis TaxID=587533 RepID=A0ABT9MW19_9ACTN|nr:putative Ig domain-containing protein [Catenuloplanes nepalensis]MDP9795643.1 type II secretory pathway pseudopilin PulG [Catenuloplanes nepalensis]
MRDRGRAGDDGFTMAETLVAIGIIGTVMMALTSFYIATIRITAQQGDRQVAIQAASDAMERVRALKPSTLITGRDLNSTTVQWNNPVRGVSSLLSLGTMAYDINAATGAGSSAALPTTFHAVQINGLSLKQYYYVSNCLRAAGASTECLPIAPGVSFLEFYRVVVGVTWNDPSCQNAVCSYVTSTLIGKNTAEPIFNYNGTAEALRFTTTYTEQVNTTGLAINLPFTATGGKEPYAWSAQGLPAGLRIDPAGGLITGTPTGVSTGPVTVTVRDADNRNLSTTFTWTINGLPVITPVEGNSLRTVTGMQVTRVFTVAGGTAPFTWSAQGLPSGLAMDAATGVVTGVPVTLGSSNVTLIVVDKAGNQARTTFSWVVPAMEMAQPANYEAAKSTAVSYPAPAVNGGTAPYVWSLGPGAPAWLAVDVRTGTLSGTTPATGSAVPLPVTLFVTDSKGVTASRIFTVTVKP